MDLIGGRGLNCHLASVISMAASLGIRYQDAFGTLWSETDFAEDPKYHIYLSRRVLPNLEALGARPEALPCASPAKAEESFSSLPEGELFFIGTDSARLPWSPFYQGVCEPHYFFAQKEARDTLLCFDPIYKQKNARLAPGAIIPHAFDLGRIRRTAAGPPPFGLDGEARAILRGHPETRDKLRAEIDSCKRKEQKNIVPLIKQINAMINNRYLFRRFLRQGPLGRDRRFFDRDFFSRWEAVKNGLYKAAILRDNESVTDEANRLFLRLMREETDMAKEMMPMTGSDAGREASFALPCKAMR